MIERTCLAFSQFYFNNIPLLNIVQKNNFLPVFLTFGFRGSYGGRDGRSDRYDHHGYVSVEQ